MKEKNNKETSKVSKTLSTIWNRFLKPFFKGLWVLSKIILFGLLLYMFSEYVLQGISENSVINLTIGVGGYMFVSIVALLLIYQLLFAANTREDTPTLFLRMYNLNHRLFWLGKDLDNTARQMDSLKNDLKLSELGWKLDDVLREIKDLKQSLKQ
jgi:hypothetical protein